MRAAWLGALAVLGFVLAWLWPLHMAAFCGGTTQ